MRVYYDYDVDGIWQEGDKFTYTAADGTEKDQRTLPFRYGEISGYVLWSLLGLIGFSVPD